MKTTSFFTFLIFCWQFTAGQAVSVTNPANTTPALAASYTSLANALVALNSITAISGPVTITLNAGNPQTTPAGGYVINFTAATTAFNTITIAGSNNTITAFTPQAAGSTTDALFKMIGADHVTIRDFILTENPLNLTTTLASNNMTEWGVALLCRSTSDGSQFNTITNNTISLKRIYSNTFGIYSNTRHLAATPTVAMSILNGTTAPNHGNRIYNNSISQVNMGICFIGAGNNAANMDTGNDIGGSGIITGNTITDFGGLAAITSYVSNTGSCYGVFMNHQVNDNVANNTIVSAALFGTAINVRGIYKNYASLNPSGTFTSTIRDNTVTMINNFNGGTFEVIKCESVTGSTSGATILIEGNIISGNVVGSSTGPHLTGINNTFACGSLEITGNIFISNTSASATGGFTGIQNTAAVSGSIRCDNNNFGSSGNDAIVFSTATSGTLTGISNTANTGTVSLSISDNFFHGFVHTVQGSGSFTCINYTFNASTSTTATISDNVFNGLNANTSGTVTIINRTGVMQANAGASETCSDNMVTDGFTTTTTGTFTVFNGTGNSLGGNTIVQNKNDFSNLGGSAGIVNGWNNAVGTATNAPTILISNNNFSNWNFPAIVTVIDCLNGGNNSAISGNTISEITCGAFMAISMRSTAGANHSCFNNEIRDISGGQNLVYGIRYFGSQSSVFNAFGNTIHNLSITTATASSTLYGIHAAPAITGNFFNNSISNLSANATSVTVAGINVAGTANNSYYIYNNIIGNLEAPQANANNVIRGISFSSAGTNSQMQVDHNTIYLNATSSGTNFGTSGIFLIANATATTGNSTLRNNLVINISTANGTGRTAALMRSSSTMSNYNDASNNNIWYAGAASPLNLIFYNVSNADQTITDFKTRVGPTRETNSQTELPTFLSLAGNSPLFLHIDPSVPTQAESGAIFITVISDDVDGDIRHGNPGYSGSGTQPDIGADEFDGIYSEMEAPSISYSALSSPACTFSGYTLINVLISDTSGVPLAGGTVPRIYYRKNFGSWFSQAGVHTGGTSTNSTWSFTIEELDMGGVSGGDEVEYFVTAQDLSPMGNVGSIVAGVVATSVNNIIAFPLTPFSYTLGFSLSGLYTVGMGGDFTTLSDAVNAYNNACSLTGPTVFELTDNSYVSPAESFPLQIFQHPDADAINTLTIRPSATSSPQITASTTTQVINFNGADHIILDGKPGGAGTGRELTVRNNGTGVAVQFINDARFNRVTSCNIKSKRAGSFTGTIVFSTAALSGSGNDHNIIDSNAISESDDHPFNAIYSSGTPGSGNDSILISGNEIFNFFSASNDNHGIFVNTANSAYNWKIQNNSIYQPDSRTFSGINIELYCIRITSGSGHSITGNRLGFANATGSGAMHLVGNSVDLPGFPMSYTPSGSSTAFRFFGISCDLETGGAFSQIDGNIIGGINVYSSSSLNPGLFNGIYIENGAVNIGTGQPNIIGSSSDQLSVYISSDASTMAHVNGIRVASSSNCSISNNIIGGFLCGGNTTGKTVNFTGISTGGFGSFTIMNNQVGNPVADNIRIGNCSLGGSLSNQGSLNSSSNALFANYLRGIVSTAVGNTAEISENIFQGWQTSQELTDASGISTTGFMFGSNAHVKIKYNKLGSATLPWIKFSATSNNSVTGISCLSDSKYQDVEENEIYGFSYSSPGSYQGSCKLITTSGPAVAGGVANIRNNSFHQIETQQLTTTFIEGGGTITAGATRNIEGNITSGQAAIQNPFRGINLEQASSPGAIIHVRANAFTNIDCLGTSYGVFDNEGQPGQPAPEKRITGNLLNNINCIGGDLFGLFIERLGADAGSHDSISNNSVTDLSSNHSVTGVHISSALTAHAITITANDVTSLSSSGNNRTVTGIRTSLPQAASPTRIKGNTISSLSTSGTADTTVAILIADPSTGMEIRENKIYNLSAAGTFSETSAIAIGGNSASSINEINLFNNLIGNLETPSSGNIAVPSVAAIRLKNQLPGGNIKIYNNTVYLTSNSLHSNFSSANLYSNTTANLLVDNNIFLNLSTTGPGGKAVVHWRESDDFSTYSGVTNCFFSGTPSPDRLVYYDPTNSMEVLADYQAFASPNDGSSVSLMPAFQSTNGDDAAFLHLNPFLNCSLTGKGNNDINMLERDYEGDLREIPLPPGSKCDLGADEVGKWNLWTGANSQAWNEAGNWSLGIVPNSVSQNVRIAAVPPVNQPLIATGETFQIKQLSVLPGATLFNRGTLKVAGVIKSATGAINNIGAGTVDGSFELNGFCDDVYSLSGKFFTANSVNDLVVSSDAALSSTSGEELKIHGALNFGPVSGKTFNTGDNLVLVSNVSRTARVGKITGNLITGRATVERYINTGLTAEGRHPKSWQFLSTPVSGPSIFESWQEDGSVPAGYGTIITGTGSGFDILTALPSLKYFDPLIGTGGNWAGITNTGIPVERKEGYMLMVRGDRTVTTFNAPPNPTNLRIKGFLYQPTNPPPVTIVQPGKLASVGNPYASAISVEFMRNNGRFINLDNNVIVWDPLLNGSYNLGGYQTLSSANNYEPTAGGTAYYPSGVPAPNIQSGQAFFVRSSGMAGQVSFTEACKVELQKLVNREALPRGRQFFRTRLYTEEGNIADGNALVVSTNFSNTIDEEDASKLRNAGENFSILSVGKELSVEARKNILHGDTLRYHISNVSRQGYIIRIYPKYMDRSHLLAFFGDRFMGTERQISLTDSSEIRISINDDPNSYKADRFYVVFKARTTRHIPPLYTDKAERLTPSLVLLNNPVQHMLRVALKGFDAGEHRFQITDGSGQVLKEGSLIISKRSEIVEMRLKTIWSSGHYFLTVFSPNQTSSLPFILLR